MFKSLILKWKRILFWCVDQCKRKLRFVLFADLLANNVQAYAKEKNERYDGYQRSYDMSLLLSGTHDKYSIGKY